jgi:AraC-like DNA-binding protein
MKEVLHIKNMVCDRCIMAVESELNKLDITAQSITLGEVVLAEPLTSDVKSQFQDNLEKIGFELIGDKKMQLTERVKNLIIDLIHYQHKQLNINLSDYLSEQLNIDYTYISKQFSETEQTTIEKFVILQKIERIKELISYNELTLSEISDQLHYSSVAHLSGQFKKVTGLTPSQYKNQTLKNRKPLNEV